jgi:hypothetical protein
MAARTLRPKHSDEIRAKIQASMLINALHDNVTGKKKLDSGQIKSAEILLRKSVPDLTAVEMSGELEHKGEVGIRPQLTREEWLALHKGGK